MEFSINRVNGDYGPQTSKTNIVGTRQKVTSNKSLTSRTNGLDGLARRDEMVKHWEELSQFPVLKERFQKF